MSEGTIEQRRQDLMDALSQCFQEGDMVGVGVMLQWWTDTYVDRPFPAMQGGQSDAPR
jgi:hypothetical protein